MQRKRYPRLYPMTDPEALRQGVKSDEYLIALMTEDIHELQERIALDLEVIKALDAQKFSNAVNQEATHV
jgi:hypothetical protein